jgi:hypothetical protein
MTAQLNYTVAQQHIADLRQTAERVRLTGEADARRRRSRHDGPMVRVRARLVRPSHKQTAKPLVGSRDCFP